MSQPEPALRRITIATKGDKYKSVDAYVYGDWAAHSTGAGWSMTLLLSGRSAGDALTASGARHAAEWLSRNVSRDELLDWSALTVATSDKIRRGIAIGAES